VLSRPPREIGSLKRPDLLVLLSRGSDLAVLQARLVADALRARWPGLDVALEVRSSRGDRDRGIALWASDDKGLFDRVKDIFG
jgi:porphobilinogen deaminase